MMFGCICRRSPVLLALGLAAIVSGCATVYEGRYAFNDGWRKATVEEVGPAAQLQGTALSDCRRNASAAQLQSGQFALVSYANFGHLRRRIVALPAHTRFEAGDAAYVKWRSCSGDVALRAPSQR